MQEQDMSLDEDVKAPLRCTVFIKGTYNGLGPEGAYKTMEIIQEVLLKEDPTNAGFFPEECDFADAVTLDFMAGVDEPQGLVDRLSKEVPGVIAVTALLSDSPLSALQFIAPSSGPSTAVLKLQMEVVKRIRHHSVVALEILEQDIELMKQGEVKPT